LSATTKEQNRDYYQRHREKLLDRSKRYYALHKQAILDRKRAADKVDAPQTEIVRDKYYRNYYGISLEEYNSLFDKQGGVCAICSTPPSTRRLAVDHCHDTGKVRGLLCVKCNAGIGNLNDDVEMLKAAIKYLES
jgi:hypothetical protein